MKSLCIALFGLIWLSLGLWYESNRKLRIKMIDAVAEERRYWSDQVDVLRRTYDLFWIPKFSCPQYGGSQDPEVSVTVEADTSARDRI